MNKRIRISGPCAHLDFLIIGAMQAGSTRLFEFLAAHPSVYVPQTKEPHYFSMRYYYPSSYYRWLFRERGEQQICGEASTSYCNVNRFPRCPERIANDAPNVRIIYVIRDPIEHIMSNLRYLSRRGHKIGIDTKVVTDPDLWNKSRYRDTIEAYLEFFPRSRMFVADLHDLRKDAEWLRRLLRFLELDHHSCSYLALPSISKQPDNVEFAGINADVLRERFPDLCEQLDSQYQWVRKHFLDLSEDQVTERHPPAELPPVIAEPAIEIELPEADIADEPASPAEPAPAETILTVGSTDVTTDYDAMTDSVAEPESVPQPAEPPPVVVEPEVEIIRPPETAVADKPASRSSFVLWVMLSIFMLAGSFYLLIDDNVRLKMAREFNEVSEARVPWQIQDSASAPEEPPVSVTFRFMDECWVEVSDARRRHIYALKKPGSESSFTGVLPLRVFLGNAPAVKIEVGGEAFQIPASARKDSKIARFTIDENDIR